MLYKCILTAIFIACGVTSLSAQTLQSLIAAMEDTTGTQAVQASHQYPAMAAPGGTAGQCHFTKISSIEVDSATWTVTFVEEFTGAMGPITATYTGVIKNDEVTKGTWSSSTSSGYWKYNFKTGVGSWNKPTVNFFAQLAGVKPFGGYQPFKIIVKAPEELIDGFSDCKQ